jgi:hypothetical protein
MPASRGCRIRPGAGGMFSLEGPEALSFLMCSRLFTDDEYAALQSAGRV